MSILDAAEQVPDFSDLGVMAFTTTRASGTFGMNSDEPAHVVMGRWSALRAELASRTHRMATATQVHGAEILTHGGDWRGWLRNDAADGHFAPTRGTASVVTVADCVPVFIAHPTGATMILHSGWRGTAANILANGLRILENRGLAARDLRLHLGPAVCGKCYEVSADVYAQLTGTNPGRPTTVDLRAILATRAQKSGVARITVSERCTRCDNDRFFSHRAGDVGRQIGVIAA